MWRERGSGVGLHRGRPTLALKIHNPACFPALPGLPDADYLNQVCSVNPDGESLESANQQQGRLEDRQGFGSEGPGLGSLLYAFGPTHNLVSAEQQKYASVS